MKTELYESFEASRIFLNSSDELLQFIVQGKLSNLPKFHFKNLIVKNENCVQQILEQPFDAIFVVKRDKQLLDDFLKKYDKFSFEIIDFPKLYFQEGFALFCCKSDNFKQFFEIYHKHIEDFKQFLKDKPDINNFQHALCVTKYFERVSLDNVEYYCGIFQNDFELIVEIRNSYEKVFENQQLLKICEENDIKNFLYIKEMIHNKITFYEFYYFLRRIFDEEDLKNVCFVFPNNEKEVEFYERFIKLCKDK